MPTPPGKPAVRRQRQKPPDGPAAGRDRYGGRPMVERVGRDRPGIRRNATGILGKDRIGWRPLPISPPKRPHATETGSADSATTQLRMHDSPGATPTRFGPNPFDRNISDGGRGGAPAGRERGGGGRGGSVGRGGGRLGKRRGVGGWRGGARRGGGVRSGGGAGGGGGGGGAVEGGGGAAGGAAADGGGGRGGGWGGGRGGGGRAGGGGEGGGGVRGRGSGPGWTAVGGGGGGGWGRGEGARVGCKGGGGGGGGGVGGGEWAGGAVGGGGGRGGVGGGRWGGLVGGGGGGQPWGGWGRVPECAHRKTYGQSAVCRRRCEVLRPRTARATGRPFPARHSIAVCATRSASPGDPRPRGRGVGSRRGDDPALIAAWPHGRGRLQASPGRDPEPERWASMSRVSPATDQSANKWPTRRIDPRPGPVGGRGVGGGRPHVSR